MRLVKETTLILVLQAGLSVSIFVYGLERLPTSTGRNGRAARRLTMHTMGDGEAHVMSAAEEIAETFEARPKESIGEETKYKNNMMGKKSAKSNTGKIEHKTVAPKIPENTTYAPSDSTSMHPTAAPKPKEKEPNKSSKATAPSAKGTLPPSKGTSKGTAPSSAPEGTSTHMPSPAPGPEYHKKKKSVKSKGKHEKLIYNETDYYPKEEEPKYAKAPRGSGGKDYKRSKKYGKKHPVPTDDEDYYANVTMAPTESKEAKNVGDYEDYYYYDESGENGESEFVESNEYKPKDEDPGNDVPFPEFEIGSDKGSSTSFDVEYLIPIGSALGVIVCCLACFLCHKRRGREISPNIFTMYESKLHGRRVDEVTMDGTAELSDARTFTFSEDGIERRTKSSRSTRVNKGSSMDAELRQVMEGIEEFEEVSLHEEDEENQGKWTSSGRSNGNGRGAFRSFSDILSSATPPIRVNISHDDSTVSDIYMKDDEKEVKKNTDGVDPLDVIEETQKKNSPPAKDETEQKNVIDLTAYEQDTPKESKDDSLDNEKTNLLRPATEKSSSPNEESASEKVAEPAPSTADPPTETSPPTKANETESPKDISSSVDPEDATPAWMKNLRSKPKAVPPPEPAKTEDANIPEWMRKYNEMKFQKADE